MSKKQHTANLYVITITNYNGYVYALSWTASSSQRNSWDRFISHWGKFCAATTRKGQINELKRKERARVIKIAVPCFKVY